MQRHRPGWLPHHHGNLAVAVFQPWLGFELVLTLLPERSSVALLLHRSDGYLVFLAPRRAYSLTEELDSSVLTSVVLNTPVDASGLGGIKLLRWHVLFVPTDRVVPLRTPAPTSRGEMRPCAAVAPLGLLLSVLLSQTRASLVPFTLRSPESGLGRRDVYQPSDLVRPESVVHLMYADGEARPFPWPRALAEIVSRAATASSYHVKVTASHNSRPFVLVENFEHMLSAVSCSPGPGDGSTTLTLTFRDEHDLSVAKREWSGRETMTFVTHHDSCNSSRERAAYR